jgi:hypothetical protein
MSVALRSCALLLAVAGAGSTADPVVEELFQLTREKVLDNARRMPRYTCVETISRAQYQPAFGSLARCAAPPAGSSRGNLMQRDRLRLDVTVVDDGEIFSWAGAGKFETHDVDQIVGTGGASGSGEFGTFLSSVFGSAPEEIRYAGRRNSLALFEYDVPLATSPYRFHTTGRPGKTLAFRGNFSVDPSDGDLQQLVVESDDFAPRDDVCRVRHVMDYSGVKICSADFLLPEVSTMDAFYRNGEESLNETHYSDCREYVGDSTIRFDEVDAAAGTAASKSTLQPLPPKVRLPIGLSKPIDTETAAAGDAVEGVLLSDVTDRKQRTMAKLNVRVHGRILRLQQYMEPTPVWIVAIRFETIERDGMQQPIALKPVDDGYRSDRSIRMRGTAPLAAYQRPPGAGVFVFAEHGNIVLDQKFHSDWETR